MLDIEFDQLVAAATELKSMADRLNDMVAIIAHQRNTKTPPQRRYIRRPVKAPFRDNPDLMRDVPPHSMVPYPIYHALLRSRYPYNPTGYGAKRALLDYNAAERRQHVSKVKITEQMEQGWLRDGVVPGWACNYLRAIKQLPQRVHGQDWTESEIHFLASLITDRKQLNYDEIAEMCSKKFKRPIGVNAIKGATDRHEIGRFAKKSRAA